MEIADVSEVVDGGSSTVTVYQQLYPYMMKIAASLRLLGVKNLDFVDNDKTIC